MVSLESNKKDVQQATLGIYLGAHLGTHCNAHYNADGYW